MSVPDVSNLSGPFAELRKSEYYLRHVCLSVCLYVCLSLCLSVRTEQLSSQWTDFHEIWYLRIFRKPAEKIQVSLKSDNNNSTLHKDLCKFMIISRWITLRIRNISDKNCRENQNTHFMFNNFFQKSCRLWDNVEKYGRARQDTDDNIIRRMRFVCWITKATDTHWEYVILIAYQRQQWLRERASVLIIRSLTVLRYCDVM
jgi:hypothetical protein